MKILAYCNFWVVVLVKPGDAAQVDLRGPCSTKPNVPLAARAQIDQKFQSPQDKRQMYATNPDHLSVIQATVLGRPM